MRLLVVNPNTTSSMTEKIGLCARAVAHPETKIILRNPVKGPPSVEGHYDGALAAVGLLEEVKRAESEGVDGVVIACFDDPGTGACREIATGPVLGICEAAMHAASIVSNSFSVITTLPRSIPIIENLALRYGMQHRCRRVRAADVSVLSLEQNCGARERILDEIRKSIVEDGSEAIILGCAGMADLAAWLSAQANVPVIDGVVAAVKIVEGLAGVGLKTSKIGAYAQPIAKTIE